MTIIATIIVLGVLIFVHELGHFWAAKWVGIHVERFSIGLGPRVWGFTHSGTEYVLSAIPLGGYVKMKGMGDEMLEKIEGGAPTGEGDGDPDPPSPEASPRAAAGAPSEGPSETALAPGRDLHGGGDPGRRRRSRRRDDGFESKSLPARALVISAGVAMNMLFAFAAYAAVAAVWGEGAEDTTRVGYVHEEVLPEGTEGLADLPRGSHLVRIGDRDVGHWGDVRRALRGAPDGPLEIAFTDPEGAVTVDLPADPETRALAIRALHYWNEARIQAIFPGSPAADGGIEPGDRILAVNGDPVELWEEVVQAIRNRPGERLELLLERNGRELSRAVTSEAVRDADPYTGETGEIGRIGVLPMGPEVIYEPIPVTRAMVLGAEETVAVTGLILGFLRDLVTGQLSVRNLGSIVTIGEASGQAAEAGMAAFLRFMALFSINLAILNLLPIPILDGGYLVFLAVEAVRGRPLSMEARLRWTQVGFVVVLGIMVLALSNDFLRLFGL